MVKAQLRALERKLVKERATLAVHDFVDKLAYRWPQITEAEPTITTVIDLVFELWDNDVGIPTLPVAISYLEECLRKREDPGPKVPHLHDGPLVRPPRQMTTHPSFPRKPAPYPDTGQGGLLSLLPSREKVRMRGRTGQASCPFSPCGRRLG